MEFHNGEEEENRVRISMKNVRRNRTSMKCLHYEFQGALYLMINTLYALDMQFVVVSGAKMIFFLHLCSWLDVQLFHLSITKLIDGIFKILANLLIFDVISNNFSILLCASSFVQLFPKHPVKWSIINLIIFINVARRNVFPPQFAKNNLSTTEKKW